MKDSERVTAIDSLLKAYNQGKLVPSVCIRMIERVIGEDEIDPNMAQFLERANVEPLFEDDSDDENYRLAP